jgi:ubiquinone/menaquinone biosynthesis C-methylase UbiE/uncharacterized protein YbaR (Trm112 family)
MLYIDYMTIYPDIVINSLKLFGFMTKDLLRSELPLVCPKCKELINKNIFNSQKGEIICSKCKKKYVSHQGSYDLTLGLTAEKTHYEDKYELKLRNKESLNFNKLKKEWYDPIRPEAILFLDELQKHELKDKNILLLGNGISIKELYLLSLGANIVYSDISLNAILRVKNEFNYKKFRNNITFHAIDGLNIPFPDKSIDFVIGYGFSHHLDDKCKFLREVHRVLKPGGWCIFFDDSFSKLWHFLKWNIFSFLTNSIQHKAGVSPEDARASIKGGYKKNEIERWMKENKFDKMIYLRFGFSFYIFREITGRLFSWSVNICNTQRKIIPFLFIFDQKLSKKFPLIYNNTLLLIWGFKK